MLARTVVVLAVVGVAVVAVALALRVTGCEAAGAAGIAVPPVMAPPLGLIPLVGVCEEVVRGPLKLMVTPVVLVIFTLRNTMVLPLYLEGLAAKSATSTTNCACAFW